jgi:CheY-like chemotaxis protein
MERTSHPRVLLADDQAAVIEQAISLLQDEYEIVGIVYSGGKLISEATRLHPDIIIADISMPELS